MSVLRNKALCGLLVLAVCAIGLLFYNMTWSSNYLVKLQNYASTPKQQQLQKEQGLQFLQLTNQQLSKQNEALFSTNSLLQKEIERLNQRVNELEKEQKRREELQKWKSNDNPSNNNINNNPNNIYNNQANNNNNNNNNNFNNVNPLTDGRNAGSNSIQNIVPNGQLVNSDNAVAVGQTSLSTSTGQQLHPGVKVVPSLLPHDDLQADCVPLRGAPKPSVRICLHPSKEDVHVSGTIKRGGVWEQSLIKQMETLLQKDPQLQVVDLGCNIGEYTLWAAAMDRPVLAVEMLDSNIRLVQKSLQLSQLSSFVTLVQNALYSDRRDLKTLFLQANIGGTRLNTSSHNDPAGKVDNQKTGVVVHSILLDDLLPLVNKSRPIFMKMDIENSEHRVLQGAHQFFHELDIKYVQMEWLARTKEEIDIIRDFMTKYGYVPRTSAFSPAVADLNKNTIQGDVIFIKEGNGSNS